MDERIPAHYVSPMSTEDEMSVEDMLAEIPEDDLQSVAIVQGHIYMPLPLRESIFFPRSECTKHYPPSKMGASKEESKQQCYTQFLINRSSISLEKAAILQPTTAPYAL